MRVGGWHARGPMILGMLCLLSGIALFFMSEAILAPVPKRIPRPSLLVRITSGDHQDDVSPNKGSIRMFTTNTSVSSNRSTMPEAAQRPQWLEEQLYPFQSRFVEIEGNRLHYIDEGSGPILFLLHPSIGWSFIYADIIKELRTRFRCIALALPGFGLSSAVPGYQHTLTGDSRLIERFIQMLGLTDVTLLAHDITGSIGLGVVGRRPEWFRAVIIL